MTTKKKDTSHATWVNSSDAAVVSENALRGAKSIRGLARDEYEDCCADAVASMIARKERPHNLPAYAYEAGRNRALKRKTDQARESRVGESRAAAGAPAFVSGRRQQAIRTGKAELEELARVRSNLVRHISALLDTGALLRKADVEQGAYRFASRQIQRELHRTPPWDLVEKLQAYRRSRIKLGEGWVENAATIERGFTTAGRPKSFAGRSLASQARELRHAAAERIVDKALHLCGFNARETNATKRAEAAKDAKFFAKWTRRMRAAVMRDEAQQALASMRGSLSVDRTDEAERVRQYLQEPTRVPHFSKEGVTIAEILEAIGLEPGGISRADETRAGRVLRALKWTARQVTENRVRVRRYFPAQPPPQKRR